MLSHRIDYGHFLIGPIARLVAQLRRFIDLAAGNPPTSTTGSPSSPTSRTDATGVLESTKLATGRGEGHRGLDVCEVNGSEGIHRLHHPEPLELQIGRRGDADLRRVPVPKEFLDLARLPARPRQGDPLITFRYDQNFEFIDAIREQRPCSPSFLEGARPRPSWMPPSTLPSREIG